MLTSASALPRAPAKPASEYSFVGGELVDRVERMQRPSTSAPAASSSQESTSAPAAASSQESASAPAAASQQESTSAPAASQQESTSAHASQQDPDAEDWVIVELDREEQTVLYRQIATRLNIQGHAMEAYIARNGPLSAQEPFGEFHWRGLLIEFMEYRWRHVMGNVESLEVGWVLIPAEFSRAEAQLGPLPADYEFYPAIIWRDARWARIACKHIAVMNSRPWWVHLDRLFQLRRMRQVWQFYDRHVQTQAYRFVTNRFVPEPFWEPAPEP